MKFLVRSMVSSASHCFAMTQFGGMRWEREIAPHTFLHTRMSFAKWTKHRYILAQPQRLSRRLSVHCYLNSIEYGLDWIKKFGLFCDSRSCCGKEEKSDLNLEYFFRILSRRRGTLNGKTGMGLWKSWFNDVFVCLSFFYQSAGGTNNSVNHVRRVNER